MIALTLLSLVGYCFILRRCTNWPIETAPLFIIATLISALYGFAYFNQLHVGLLVSIGLGLGCLLLSPLYIQRKQLYSYYLTPSFSLLFLFSILLAIVAEQSHFYLWDEFTQWGAHAKFIALMGQLWTQTTEVIHPTYPPGAALFYNLFYPFGHYHEGTTYFAQQLLLLLPLGVLLSDSRWVRWKRVFLTLALGAVLLMILHVHMGAQINLYLDSVVGIFFGACLWQSRRIEKRFLDGLYFVPILFALMLLKVKLLGFGLLILGFMWIGGIPISAVLCSLAAMSFAHWSWLYHVRFVPVKMHWALHRSWTQIVHQFLSLNFTAAQKATAHHFATACIKVLPFVALLLLVIYGAYRCLAMASERRRFVADHAVLALGFLGFLVSLFMMYLFAFGSYEGVQLASFSRYVDIYLVGWAIFAYGGLTQSLRSLKFRSKKQWVSLSTGFLLLGFPIFLMATHAARIHKDKQPNSLWHTRKALRRVAKSVGSVVPKHAKMLTVWQDSTGLERAILTYELIPRQLNPDATSYGTPYYPGDVWTDDLSSQAFEQRASAYDYVLLAYTDKNFWTHYGRLFLENVREYPFAQYLICRSPGFNGFRKAGCTVQPAPVYLFHVMHHENKVLMQEVV